MTQHDEPDIQSLPPKLQDLLQSNLEEGEYVRWFRQPCLTPVDWKLAIMMWLCGGFFLTLALHSLISGSGSGREIAGLLLLATLCITPPFIMLHAAAATTHALTNKRLVELRGWPRAVLKTSSLDGTEAVGFHVLPNGKANIALLGAIETAQTQFRALVSPSIRHAESPAQLRKMLLCLAQNVDEQQFDGQYSQPFDNGRVLRLPAMERPMTISPIVKEHANGMIELTPNLAAIKRGLNLRYMLGLTAALSLLALGIVRGQMAHFLVGLAVSAMVLALAWWMRRLMSRFRPVMIDRMAKTMIHTPRKGQDPSGEDTVSLGELIGVQLCQQYRAESGRPRYQLNLVLRAEPGSSFHRRVVLHTEAHAETVRQTACELSHLLSLPVLDHSGQEDSKSAPGA